MITALAYTLLSVLVVSLISLIGIFTLGMGLDRLKKVVFYFISFSAGALLGDAFFHLLPEAVSEKGFVLEVSLAVLLGIGVAFVVEKIILWRHCHIPTNSEHPHPFALMNMFGDSVHNFIDGLIIGASYLVSIPIGIATTLAVVLHEIPQEIGDFGVLIHGGFSQKKALFYNFITALTAFLGAIFALVLNNWVAHLTNFLLPFAAGGFIYIAGADLIPEMHKEVEIKKSLLQLLLIVLGAAVILSLGLLE